jgi:3-methylcrotonyl-CoA carboxylase alpha subunit
MFKALLIANRGEIACRVARTAHRMGIRTIAVYSDADAGALHTRVANTAVRIGPPNARESYLSIEAIIRAAQATGAQAIHPGYGFLSQSAPFAEACAKAGIIFVGPPAAAIRAMGVKDQAKSLMQGADVPTVPGYLGEQQDDATLATKADAVGYPLLIKAVSGGGGKGMRIVRKSAEFAAALASARGEAERAFGDGRVMLERYIEHARHVEVQVIADRHGNTLHLLERDCSLQRRYQKIIEEAPAPGISEKLRARLHQSAVAAARAVGYENAGTVEFVVDGDECFFLEMNTRLQVEHPVTEMILGIDLVEWQLRVAAGEKLPLAQSEIVSNGHAFEGRVYAEDPRRNFLPSGGVLKELHWPANTEFAPLAPTPLRIDAGVEPGDRVVTDYDALLAKVIVHAADRAQALHALREALAQIRIEGATTNLAALIALAKDEDVQAGRVFTRLIDERGDALLPELSKLRQRAAALAALSILERNASQQVSSPWGSNDGWTVQGNGATHFRFQETDGTAVSLKARRCNGGWDLSTQNLKLAASHLVLTVLESRDAAANVLFGAARIEGERVTWTARVEVDRVAVWLDGEWHRFGLVSQPGLAGAHASKDALQAPMPGVVLAVRASDGEQVQRGQILIVLEAMKMEHSLAAGGDGRVTELRVKAGDRVREGDLLLKISPPGD